MKTARDAYAGFVCRPRVRLGSKALMAATWLAAALLWWFAIDYLPRHWPLFSFT